MKKQLIVVLAIAQVVFLTSIECKDCVRKVQENISFEKGVKDLSCDLPSGKVTVTFNTSKTDTLKLQKAVEKLGFSAKVVEYKEIK